MRVDIQEHAGEFAEDKDVAAAIREQEIRPAAFRRESIVLDFSGVQGATQSFIHALIADVVRSEGPDVLQMIEFHSCNPIVRSIVGIVVEYSQLDMPAKGV